MALTRRVTAAAAIISNGEPHLVRVVSLLVHAACRPGVIYGGKAEKLEHLRGGGLSVIVHRKEQSISSAFFSSARSKDSN